MSDTLINTLDAAIRNIWLNTIIMLFILALIYRKTKHYGVLIVICIIVGSAINRTIRNQKMKTNAVRITATIIKPPTYGKSSRGCEYEYYYSGVLLRNTLPSSYNNMKIGEKFTIIMEGANFDNYIIDTISK
jgi:hypothetical protein